MKFNLFKKKDKKNAVEPVAKTDNTEKKKLGQMDVTYHRVSKEELIPNMYTNDERYDRDMGSSNVVIDNIEVSPNLKRSKELLDKLNARDKHGDFKTECIKFQNELKAESDKIASMTESFINRVNKYMSDVNVI